MVLTMYRTDLPEWVMSNIQTKCSYCGAYIADNSDTGTTSARWCINPVCPGHMAHRMKFVADFFGVKNFGDKTALNYIQTHKCTNHLEILKTWYGDTKPLVSLSDVATLACLEGYGETQAKQTLNSYASFSLYFANNIEPDRILLANKDYLLQCEEYFNIKPPLAMQKMLVMGTGSFHGYANREEYFRLINDAFGMYVQVIQTGKRKTGVSYLIKEHDAIDHSKSQIARECGIPIVTPAEFFALLYNTFTYTNEE